MKDWTGNKNSIYKTLGASNHTKEERQNEDYYATDPIAIDKLLEVENIDGIVWECACGEGHLSERLKQLGHQVYSTDIVNRNNYVDKIVDFLEVQKRHSNCHIDIITNPPYKYATEFVLKALDLVDNGRKVCMFLKLQFLEGIGRYNDLFSKYPPKTIYVFSKRIMCAKNGEFEKMKQGGGSAVAYAWYVWEKGNYNKTEIRWI